MDRSGRGYLQTVYLLEEADQGSYMKTLFVRKIPRKEEPRNREGHEGETNEAYILSFLKRLQHLLKKIQRGSQVPIDPSG